MLEGFVNTSIVLVVSLVGTIFIGTMAAYALDRFAFRGKKLVFALFLVATLIPSVTSQVATFQLINGLGLYDTKAALILLFMGTDIIAIYLFIQFMQSIPVSLDEAAMIDGANRWTIYWRIVLPLLQARDRDGRDHQGHRDLQRVLRPVPLPAVRGPDLDVAVPVQGTVRRAVGGHRRRHRSSSSSRPSSPSCCCSAGSTRASPQEPSSDRLALSCRSAPRLDGWTLRAAAGPAPARRRRRRWMPATPGCVHTDLLAAGLIPDPFLDDNESALAWIGLVDWTYRDVLRLGPDDADRTDLVFDGPRHGGDDPAQRRASSARPRNQHRSLPLRRARRARRGRERARGARSARPSSTPTRRASRSARASARTRSPTTRSASRRAASGGTGASRPTRAASGAGRGWSPGRSARLAQMRVRRDAGGRRRHDRRSTSSSSARGDAARSTLTVARRRGRGRPRRRAPAQRDRDASCARRSPDVERWWPVGYGEQPLYDVDVELAASDGDVLDRATRRVGFRDVRWDTDPDAAGHAVHARRQRPAGLREGRQLDPRRRPPRAGRRATALRRRFEQALDANLNLIRVWGGGIYESDDFYELCDELGLLVWQDFLFACAAYAEEEPLRSEVEAEARENIVRLGHHASLVLLTGNNENLWGYEDWGWKLRLDGKTWGAHYYYELFPALVAELAPHVPYAPGSPFSPGAGWDGERRPAAPQRRAARLDAPVGAVEPARLADLPRPPAAVRRRVRLAGAAGVDDARPAPSRDAPLTPESPGMIVHQKAMEGNTKLTNGLIPHFRMPEAMEDWHWAMQLNQALAVRTALEHFRSWAPHTQGAIVWQLNDCWPVTSWAAIDGDERPKPLYYALKNAFAPAARHRAAARRRTRRGARERHRRAVGRRARRRGASASRATSSPGSRRPSRSLRGRRSPSPLPADVATTGDAASELVVAGVGRRARPLVLRGAPRLGARGGAGRGRAPSRPRRHARHAHRDAPSCATSPCSSTRSTPMPWPSTRS